LNNEKECLCIQDTALNNPELANLLIPLFSPSTTSTNTFLQAYKNIIKHCNSEYEPIALKLLSKVRTNLIVEYKILIHNYLTV